MLRVGIELALRRNPVVGLLGMRQVGGEISARRRGPGHFFDLG